MNPRIAITHGDTNGIGYELIYKAFAEPEMLEMLTPVVYGTQNAATEHARIVQTECHFNVVQNAAEARENRLNFVECLSKDVEMNIGTATKESAQAARESLRLALEDFEDGQFGALVLSPSNEDEVAQILSTLKTEEESGEGAAEEEKEVHEPIEIIGNERISMTYVLSDNMASELTPELVVAKVVAFKNAICRDLRIDKPRVALMSFGEETDQKVAELLKEKKIDIFGPYTEEQLFTEELYSHFDGVVMQSRQMAMNNVEKQFDNQGAILVSGLPLVVTKPLQRPSFGIAGKNEADESSMRNAIYTAIDAMRCRSAYDYSHRNPLRKLYHERREDGEKVRFKSPIPPKHEH